MSPQKKISFSWDEISLQLSYLKCIYWEAENALLLSDVHLGKTNHFRKNGIAISSEVANMDYINLELAINHFNPNKIIIIGDLFHSVFNKEVNFFGEWKKVFSHIKWILVKGNHDILHNSTYQDLQIEVVDKLIVQNICFLHEPHTDLLNQFPSLKFITGHIHPAIKVKLGVHQTNLPCFFFSNQVLILPAFGRFTGVHVIKSKKENRIFCITNDSIIAYQ